MKIAQVEGLALEGLAVAHDASGRWEPGVDLLGEAHLLADTCDDAQVVETLGREGGRVHPSDPMQAVRARAGITSDGNYAAAAQGVRKPRSGGASTPG